MTICRFVKGLLTEAMTVSELTDLPGIFGHTFGCSHDGLNSKTSTGRAARITYLCDLGTVGEHGGVAEKTTSFPCCTPSRRLLSRPYSAFPVDEPLAAQLTITGELRSSARHPQRHLRQGSRASPPLRRRCGASASRRVLTATHDAVQANAATARGPPITHSNTLGHLSIKV